MNRINYIFVALGFIALIACFGNLAFQATPLGQVEYLYYDISLLGGISWLMPILAALAITSGFLRVFKRAQLRDLNWWTVLIASIGIVLCFIVQEHAMSSLNNYSGSLGSTAGWGIYLQLLAYIIYLIFGIILYQPEDESINKLSKLSPYARKDIVFIFCTFLLYILILECNIFTVTALGITITMNFNTFNHSIIIRLLALLVLLALIIAPTLPRLTHIFYKTATSFLTTLIAITIIYPITEHTNFLNDSESLSKGMTIEYGIAYFSIPIFATILMLFIWIKWKQEQKSHPITPQK
ncbi:MULTISPECIES: hypothetical protein [Deefgea]|uniref:Uncharacterized protein n=1 Tax=Deefgea chitinilytica TaxID=570276 RepID=A0ABS2CDV5_9NEIS|nr:MULTISPECIES: hypothetical protein [Deefgea]MBM5572319.1 hypothetical protein [Deefgea chitinilytica]MBM9889555.1 hypothetical protein [Deefgea sp. CFH1-16]